MDEITKQLIDLNFKYDDFLEKNNSKRIQYVKHDCEFGEIVKIDAFVHKWLNNEKYFIYYAVDTGTVMLLATTIEKEETNVGYTKLLKNLFKTHGYLGLIKTDKRTTFWSHNSKTNMTQCLNNLDIEVESKNEPASKVNVERSLRSAQDFYPYYFYINNMKSCEDFEKNVEKIIETYKTQFSKTSTHKEKAFTKVSEKKNW
ncbi:hypothetical protein [Malacoplasma iowae]|uniref:Uncharacterized protein n=1 Tax=Malacoplasma iowae 695 TaxID=1048830 RepID=A0A6P1LAN4_MALIO|nr:hypothetical protein [Malacoplasma iowae]VEU63002.1 Uncharacterised protein [Mycoplasmopsis fermentans]EGZ31301.1 transposase [Malacoplasma iowae 695]QHG89486.1 hypothetical protein EER00_01055 [Malacoplasma iowae 695]WPL35742.1 hypothetical protein QX180_05470 [Malacoplasma iowae]WPL35759.1 hypothetical protein QX180_05560 [Malacoplasma iowae]